MQPARQIRSCEAIALPHTTRTSLRLSRCEQVTERFPSLFGSDDAPDAFCQSRFARGTHLPAALRELPDCLRAPVGGGNATRAEQGFDLVDFVLHGPAVVVNELTQR